jgi:hypothetical protein
MYVCRAGLQKLRRVRLLLGWTEGAALRSSSRQSPEWPEAESYKKINFDPALCLSDGQMELNTRPTESCG